MREIEPWEEGGDRWRRLHVTFPPGLPTHSREQVFYFDAAGLLRRHDGPRPFPTLVWIDVDDVRVA